MMRIDAKNIESVQEQLRHLAKKLDDPSELMANIAETLHTLTDEAFEFERAPNGTQWADLKPATWKRKRTKKKLYESGRLQGSLYASSGKNEDIVGVNAVSKKGYPYPAVHQFGSKRVPARPFLPIDADGDMYEEVVEEIVEMIEEYLES